MRLRLKKLAFKVQKQSFTDMTFLRTLLMAPSKNLRNVFAQKIFSHYMRNLSWNSEKPSSFAEVFCSKVKMLLKISQNSQENSCYKEVAYWATPTLWKSSGDLLWILHNSHNLLHNPIVICRDFTCF